MNSGDELSSFRDPSGTLFYFEGILYRRINKIYEKHYDYFINSGLYDRLASSEMLISHQEIGDHEQEKKIIELEKENDRLKDSQLYKIIKPEKIPFICYPYEWSFTELKDAALLTLKIQKIAVEYGMTLKDCSGYNIQFKNGKPIFIDSLSFEIYEKDQIWKGYKQFCQHFLAPLALMNYKDIRLGQLLRLYLDGIPLDLASTILPMKTRANFSIMAHIHAHAKSQKYYEDTTKRKTKRIRLSKNSFLGIIESLHSAIKKQTLNMKQTEWGDYYSDTNYSQESFEYKKKLVSELLEEKKPKMVWDLGGNIGIFSRLASSKGIPTISFDIDPLAVEKNYLESKKNNEQRILPLLLDLTNPSSSIGWNNEERMSLAQRGPAEMILALALLHHLAISNNIPFEKISKFLSRITKSFLIIEFVPKEDSQVQRLLVSREDIFKNYTVEYFEKEFSKYFKIQNILPIKGTQRVLYLMEKKYE